MARMEYIGTAHFFSFLHAVKYYSPYGFDSQDVQEKIDRGEIFVGAPVAAAGTVELDVHEGRYMIAREGLQRD